MSQWGDQREEPWWMDVLLFVLVIIIFIGLTAVAT